MRILRNPALFSYIMIALSAAQSLRWAVERRWWSTAYWLLAAGITYVVMKVQTQ